MTSLENPQTVNDSIAGSGRALAATGALAGASGNREHGWSRAKLHATLDGGYAVKVGEQWWVSNSYWMAPASILGDYAPELPAGDDSAKLTKVKGGLVAEPSSIGSWLPILDVAVASAREWKATNRYVFADVDESAAVLIKTDDGLQSALSVEWLDLLAGSVGVRRQHVTGAKNLKSGAVQIRGDRFDRPMSVWRRHSAISVERGRYDYWTLLGALAPVKVPA